MNTPANILDTSDGAIKKRDAYLKVLTRHDTHINDEYQWIGQRLTWLLTSNSFLLLAFITAITAPSFWRHPSSIDDPKFELLVRIYFRGLPLIGLASCLFVFVGVIAAQIVVSRHRRKRDALEAEAQKEASLTSVSNPTLGRLNLMGMSAGFIMPVSLFILWGFIEYAVCTGDVLFPFLFR